MRVSDVMTPRPITAEVQATVREVARQMLDGDCGEIPLTDGGRLAGVLTDRDIACRVVAAGLDPAATLAGDVMTGVPQAIGPDEAITVALRVMEKEQVRRIPVVDEAGEVVGIVSMTDLCQRMPHWTAGELLREISRDRGRQKPSGLEMFPPHVPWPGPLH